VLAGHHRTLQLTRREASDHFGRPASIAASTAGSSGAVRGSNRVMVLPSAETTNFSKFHRMSPL
jgi:hypothetical protein